MFPDESITEDEVRLRQLRSGDTEDVAAAIDEEMLRWLPLLPDPYQLWHAETFCGQLAPPIPRSGSGIVKAVEVGDRFAGVIDVKKADWQGLSVEVGYWTAGWARGQGGRRRTSTC